MGRIVAFGGVLTDRQGAMALAAGVAIRPGNQTADSLGVGRPARGSWDVRVLLQDTAWWDRESKRWTLAAMSQDYLAKVLGFIRAEEPRLVTAASFWILADAVTGRIDRRESDRQGALLSQLDSGWTRQTPLGIRLESLLRTHRST